MAPQQLNVNIFFLVFSYKRDKKKIKLAGNMKAWGLRSCMNNTHASISFIATSPSRVPDQVLLNCQALY